MSVSSAFPPTVTGVNPDNGAGAGGTSVTITGSNFTGATATHFGAISASFTVNSDTQITAVVSNGSGTAVVRVTTPEDTSNGRKFEYD